MDATVRRAPAQRDAAPMALPRPQAVRDWNRNSGAGVKRYHCPSLETGRVPHVKASEAVSAVMGLRASV